MEKNLLEVNHLYTCFTGKKGITKAVNDASFSVKKGQTLGIVGESGSGKSVSAMSILGLLNRYGYIDGGEILFEGKDLTKLSEKEMCRLRGSEISMIFQEPMTSLNPVYTVGKQIAEVFQLHQEMGKQDAMNKAVEMLKEVRIPDAEKAVQMYPHQLSGGMRQRVMIAMALACEPKLLIADEPTTALDVTIQAQILKLMNELQEKKGTAILFISHDLGVIKQMADEVVVMYAGEIVEAAPQSVLFSKENPWSHPYTEGLMSAIPRIDSDPSRRLAVIPGMVPDPMDLPKGCKFAPRCRFCQAICKEQAPELTETGSGQKVRCFFPAKEDRE